MSQSALLKYEIVEQDENPVDHRVSGEVRLLMAVIERAALDYVDHGLSMEAKRNLRLWLTEPQRHPYEEFTFLWICEKLDICPRGMRMRILDENLPRKHSPWRASRAITRTPGGVRTVGGKRTTTD